MYLSADLVILDSRAVANPAVVAEDALVVLGEDQDNAEHPHAHDRQSGGGPAEEHFADAVVDQINDAAIMLLICCVLLETCQQNTQYSPPKGSPDNGSIQLIN